MNGASPSLYIFGIPGYNFDSISQWSSKWGHWTIAITIIWELARNTNS